MNNNTWLILQLAFSFLCVLNTAQPIPIEQLLTKAVQAGEAEVVDIFLSDDLNQRYEHSFNTLKSLYLKCNLDILFLALICLSDQPGLTFEQRYEAIRQAGWLAETHYLDFKKNVRALVQAADLAQKTCLNKKENLAQGWVNLSKQPCISIPERECALRSATSLCSTKSLTGMLSQTEKEMKTMQIQQNSENKIFAKCCMVATPIIIVGIAAWLCNMFSSKKAKKPQSLSSEKKDCYQYSSIENNKNDNS